MAEDIFDLTVIGGGTTGLFATYYASMRGMSVKVIESQSEFGGKVMQFFPEKRIYDVGGFPDIFGESLVYRMIDQARRHEPVMITGEWIENIEKRTDDFRLRSSEGRDHYSKAVLLATGNGTFHTKTAPEWEALPHPTFRQQVASHLMHKERYHNKRVVIASDNKVGVGWALYLKDQASSVTVVNPNETFHQVKDADLQALLDSHVTVYFQSSLTDLQVVDEQLEYVQLLDKDQQIVTIEADEIVTFHGLELQQTPFADWGVTIEKGRIPVKGDMATNVAGIFAAGDIVQYEGKTNLIASGYTEAITAVNRAHQSIDPKATEQLYSTVIYRN
ncbi:ferredoxin--NADP reductase [Gracilibacillus halophilus YIM-C55.5]|uniref:Ferredoxin--NADP reductase n=1 Tax=Gracilibacillus halophilus YIM-C55.5 TaxID=1308866 RepID=N4WPQ6_9BACI|nr:NAD(P)/FAD-dependent oxidoreductase [Gracilibacillus halophilus]ENH96450.1 ferredoxin--NADP reductase [Gracilibacillus halophilus YIM-C55.5]